MHLVRVVWAGGVTTVNNELCLDTADIPVSVSFSAGYLTDPNNDLNPATTVDIIQR